VKLPDKFQAAESWQAQVSQHHLTLVFGGAAQTLVTATANGDFETFLLEHVTQVCSQTNVVFNEEDLGRDSHSWQCP
jgi:hypothetical protein